ncbi:hypothetical protein [Amycolatopsis sp. EV170708-02-1]|uniref:hypothetical protein n=1 Tax=Amycolatopsis sp. EV170708-02-1 TaxID=2919322 RepID=UPI001F0BB72D|nr:hypothetical protein [Amycolatopsis sp. EV170708-02-1]UMP04213.1 hypothetical protein MJQ72_04975 [Amycolatopsis sp. EV170708-02-1]
MNLRAALRMVRDWSQRDAADQWNARWPAEPKTFKNFSYWELWPGPTGHAPSLDVLGRLAELYECSISDLLDDCANFRSNDSAYKNRKSLARISRVSKANTLSAEAGEAQGVGELISTLELIDVNELARLATEWSGALGTYSNRRSLLLKLSAGLSLAAASPALADDIKPADSATELSSDREGLAGIWHSQYTYSSSGRGKDFIGQHYVVIRQQGNKLIGQSLPHSTGSSLRLELAVDGSVATGSWRETTSPHGYYKGATYHGTLQLIVDPSARRMHGMWLGFGREFVINSGQWALSLESSSIGKSSQREYHNKA